MRLSTRARYTLRSMIAIALQADGSKPVSLEKIAHGTQVSKRYLEQLAIALKRASLLRAVSGRGGGYVLARPAEEMKVGEIIEAAIGPINVVDCVGQPDVCLKADTCECRLIYMLINKRIKDVLNEYSLADLADRKWVKGMTAELGEDFQAFNAGELDLGCGSGGCPTVEEDDPE